MIKTILVAASGNDTDAALFNAALSIARPFGAHLEALHVRLDPVTLAVAMTTDGGTGALTAGLLDQLEEDARQREAAAHDRFIQFCRDAGLAISDAPVAGAQRASAGWRVESGEEPRWMAAYGMTADLVVAARDGREDGAGRATLEAVLVESGRPLLIPVGSPVLPIVFDRIAIAWKASPQAARAVALAMPLLARAKEIIVLRVEEQEEDGADTERLARSLAWHGLAAKVERLRPSADGPATTLLDTAKDRADLLVMGGYGHSRLREWVFGGFTQRILVDAPLPVLIAH